MQSPLPPGIDAGKLNANLVEEIADRLKNDIKAHTLVRDPANIGKRTNHPRNWNSNLSETFSNLDASSDTNHTNNKLSRGTHLQPQTLQDASSTRDNEQLAYTIRELQRIPGLNNDKNFQLKLLLQLLQRLPRPSQRSVISPYAPKLQRTYI